MVRTLAIFTVASVLMALALHLRPVLPHPETGARSGRVALMQRLVPPPDPDPLVRPGLPWELFGWRAKVAGLVGAPVRMSAALSHPRLEAGEATTVHVLARIEGVRRGPPVRRSLDLALVLDRSGSMAGPKLEKAKEAVRRLVRRLGPSDRVTLVAYGSSVSLLARRVAVDAAGRARLLAAIDAIEDMGGTFLSGALTAARKALWSGSGRERRLILLSDGRANEGLVEPAGLARLAGRLADEGVAISAIGVGEDFDEDVLLALADRSGGHYTYLRGPDGLVQAMDRELTAARQTLGRGIRLTIEPQPGVTFEKVYGRPVEHEGGAVSVRLPDVAVGDVQRVVVRLRVHAGPVGGRRIVRLRLAWTDPEGVAGAEGVVQLGSLAGRDVVCGSEDRVVLEAAARAATAEDLDAAARLYEAGRVDEARTLVQRRIEQALLESRRIGSTPLAREMRELEEAAGLADGRASPGSVPATVKSLKARALEMAR